MMQQQHLRPSRRRIVTANGELQTSRRWKLSSSALVLLAVTAVVRHAADCFAAPPANNVGASHRRLGISSGRALREAGAVSHAGCHAGARAAHGAALAAAADADVGGTVSAKGAGGLEAFWKFLRPHTIRGTILASGAMVSRVLLESKITPDWLQLLPTALCGIVALLCGNGYIVGINQIYDVSIDVINKPTLPIAAKEISIPQAWVLIIAMASLGTFLSVRLFGPLIGKMYCAGLFLGTIYSVPPLRLKQSPVAAALIIATVRGLFLNFGVYFATRSALGVPLSWSTPVVFMTCFCVVYALVIAITKDLPDVQGDRADGIVTFATRFGVDRVALAATCVLLANYAAALVWILSPLGDSLRPQVLLVAHGILACFLLRGIRRLRAADHTLDALKAFYRLIWNLFYSEYLIFPFI